MIKLRDGELEICFSLTLPKWAKKLERRVRRYKASRVEPSDLQLSLRASREAFRFNKETGECWTDMEALKEAHEAINNRKRK